MNKFSYLGILFAKRGNLSFLALGKNANLDQLHNNFILYIQSVVSPSRWVMSGKVHACSACAKNGFYQHSPLNNPSRVQNSILAFWILHKDNATFVKTLLSVFAAVLFYSSLWFSFSECFASTCHGVLWFFSSVEPQLPAVQASAFSL